MWLKSLPVDCNLSLIAGFSGESPVIGFFLGSRTTTQHKFFKYRQLALNQTLIPFIDDATFIEYNSILIDPEITISLESLLDLLPINSWDEFRMIRCSSIYQPNLILDNEMNNRYKITIKKQKSYYVSLEKIRRNNNDYLALLSQNRRKQINRSIKEYDKMGGIKVQIAENVDDALKIFDELIELQQKRWADRESKGSLSNEYIINSHKTLISTRIKHGEIQLMKVSTGNHTIGCAYNFVYNGKVLCADSGCNYLPENYYLPGFVCDYFAIMHNAMNGLYSYDFMYGEQEYKKSLSTDYDEIYDIIVQKKSLKGYIEKTTVKLHRLIARQRN